MLAKQTKLNAIEASVRHATRALADKRQQVQRVQAAHRELEKMQQQGENVQNALLDGSAVSAEDWTGRTPLSSESANAASIPPAFRTLSVEYQVIDAGLDESGEAIPLPGREEEGALVRLRRMAMWEDRMAAMLQDRIDTLRGQGADKAVQYRRLVSLCTKVPVEKVDGVSACAVILTWC